MEKTTKNTVLSKILKNSKAQDILAKYKLPCLNCAFARMEMDKLKIGEVCEMYRLDLKSLLSELSQIENEGGKEAKPL